MLNPHQSGFRADHRTVTAVYLVINDTVSAVDKGNNCASLFADSTSASDAVDHAMLQQRLCDVGFDSKSSKWFQDNLSHR